jgi:hypothetical protein
MSYNFSIKRQIPLTVNDFNVPVGALWRYTNSYYYLNLNTYHIKIK